jgi:prepilin-type N-terminal cleavage/methylation domain-containing protein
MNKKLAFTLIELLVVIAVIGILSGLIVVSMNGTTQKATIAKGQIFSNSLRNALMSNIVSEWKFDENLGTVGQNLTTGLSISDTWGLNNGTVAGNPILKDGSDCIFGQCLSFDGSDDYINSGSAASLNITQEITLEAWVKVVGTRADAYNCPVRKNGTAYMFYVENEGATNRGIDWLGRNSGNTAWLFWLNASYIPNEWMHLVGTFSTINKTAKYYKNGILIDSATNITGSILSYPTGNLLIGTNWSSAYFSGLIDGVRLYDNAIPASAVRGRYYLGLNSMLLNGTINKEEYLSKINLLSLNE